MQVSQSVRYAVFAVLFLLIAGVAWLGVIRYQADARAIAFAAGNVAEATPKQSEGADPSTAAAQPAGAAGPAASASQIVAHITGAVATPGVYHLPEGARVDDLIVAAGGALPDGEPDALNRAAPLADGEKVYLPTRQELTAAGRSAASPAAEPSPPAALGATVTPVASEKPGGSAPGAGKVNVNTASVNALESVSGIGPTTAKAIVEYRAKHGPFKRLEDLDNVSGIGPTTLKKILPSLTL